MSNDTSGSGNPYDDYWERYVEYSKTVRTWFISYGIGAPILFMAQDGLAKKVSESESVQTIISLFLLGVSLQVLVTLLNKWTNWIICTHKAKSPDKWWVKKADTISGWFLLDLGFDLATLLLFVVATYLTFTAIFHAS